LASEVQGVREFGTTDSLKTINSVLQRKLQRLRQTHEITHEYHRIGAIQGHIKDGNGTTTLINLFTEFNVVEKVIDFALDNDATDVKAKCNEVTDYIQEKLGAVPYSGIVAQCGKTFWDDLISHPSVVAAWEIWQEGRFLRERQEESGIQQLLHAGILFQRYVGKVGDVSFIPDGDARFYPTGVDGLFIQHFGPANFVETVNTIGIPFYASQEPMKHNRGIEIHTQSNPCMLCTDPALLVRGTNT
jgi:hypothetical protein